MGMVPPGIRSAAWAAGSDAPEKKEVRIGFIPLTDCSSVVMAAVNKFDEKYGIKIIASKEASWAAVRDKLVNGELDAAHVGIGFGFAALVGIPVGFMLGRFNFMNRMFDPVISLLRPVSPLAWLPIGLLVFHRADPAATWTIFICSIWPMILNTAQGVQRVPQDYLNVARVLGLSEDKVITKILFPAVLPYMLTGIRLSISTAWLVIVAAEMLTGGVGIGFWVWDEWNSLKVEHIIIAIFVIGIVGLTLEQMLLFLARRFTYESR